MRNLLVLLLVAGAPRAQADDRADRTARAHFQKGERAFNLGNNRGYSVREVIAGVERVTGKKVPVVIHPRRDGDSPALVASHDAARRVLGWTPHRGLDEILSSAWAWRQRHPRGYAE